MEPSSIDELNEMIETAVQIEAKEGYLARYLDDRAHARGVELGDKERREALELFEGYIRGVPELLSTAVSGSIGTPVEEIMAQVMRAAVAYWDEPEDLVPDELGVLGLLDDAYFSMRMLQSVSTRLQAESGHALLADDLSALDAVVRDILGSDLSDILDELVALSLSNTPVDDLIRAVEEHAGAFTPPKASTSFAGLRLDELVEARLSFAGKAPSGLRDQLLEILDVVASTLAELGPSAVGERSALIDEATAKLEAAFAAALEGEAITGEADVELAVSLLLGAMAHRVMLGRRLDRSFVVRCVDLVLDGAGWGLG